jgi:ribosomal protein S18 acetylase RimI-like enzyme
VILDGPAALARAPELSAIYRAAFTAPGYDETDVDVARFVGEQLPLHATREGFRLVHERGAFGYGYTGRPGQWWTDQMAPFVDEPLDGHFEVVCLAVVPLLQGRGLGYGVMQELLTGLPHRRALLTTWQDDRPATRLYVRMGFTKLAASVLPGSDLWGMDLS